VIEAKMLYKNFGATVALNDISFCVPDGQVLGVLGQPGCGKSTIANILSGYMACSGGSISIRGYDVEKHPKKALERVGYLPENNPIYYNMKVGEYLNFMGRLKRVPGKMCSAEIARVAELLSVDHCLHKLIYNLDRGTIRRTGIAAAIVGDPEVLLLDQPTEGLSPGDTRQIRDILKKLRQNRTMILFSNSLGEVLEICHHALILNDGKIVAYDSIARLRALAGDKNRLKLRLIATMEQGRQLFIQLSDTLDIACQPGPEGGTLDCTIETYAETDIRRQIWGICAVLGLPILEMRYINVTLEEIFLQLTGKIQGGD